MLYGESKWQLWGCWKTVQCSMVTGNDSCEVVERRCNALWWQWMTAVRLLKDGAMLYDDSKWQLWGCWKMTQCSMVTVNDSCKVAESERCWDGPWTVLRDVITWGSQQQYGKEWTATLQETASFNGTHSRQLRLDAQSSETTDQKLTFLSKALQTTGREGCITYWGAASLNGACNSSVRTVLTLVFLHLKNINVALVRLSNAI